MKKYISIVSLVVSLLLAACAAPVIPKSAISFYDDCSGYTSSFMAMTACGKENRNANCQPKGSCSPTGNAIVQYADSLAQSVKSHEITEAAARRKWIEFRMVQVNADNQRIMQNAAALRPAPTTCFTNGSVTNCY